jgi:hypothetical protein
VRYLTRAPKEWPADAPAPRGPAPFSRGGGQRRRFRSGADCPSQPFNLCTAAQTPRRRLGGEADRARAFAPRGGEGARASSARRGPADPPQARLRALPPRPAFPSSCQPQHSFGAARGPPASPGLGGGGWHAAAARTGPGCRVAPPLHSAYINIEHQQAAHETGVPHPGRCCPKTWAVVEAPRLRPECRGRLRSPAACSRFT